jgi:hypothetical protein
MTNHSPNPFKSKRHQSQWLLLPPFPAGILAEFGAVMRNPLRRMKIISIVCLSAGQTRSPMRVSE